MPARERWTCWPVAQRFKALHITCQQLRTSEQLRTPTDSFFLLRHEFNILSHLPDHLCTWVQLDPSSYLQYHINQPTIARRTAVTVIASWHSTVSLHWHIASSSGCLNSVYHNFHANFLLQTVAYLPICCNCKLWRCVFFMCVCVCVVCGL